MKKISFLLIIIISLFTYINVSATNATTLKELRSELQGLKNKKAAQQNQKQKTQGELNDVKNRLDQTTLEISEGKKQIEQAKIKIEQLNKDIAEGQESIKALMNSYEISQGDNIYLEYLFNSDSYADFVYRYTVIKQVIDYNKGKIEDWEVKVAENEQLKADLANKEIELNKKIGEYEKDIDSLGNQILAYTDDMMDIQDEIDSSQELIDYYVSLGCEENQNLDDCVSIKGDTIFRKPVVKGTITSYFGYRTHPITGVKQSYHAAIDIGGNVEGTNVYSTANGMVAKIVRKASCGGNQVYIHHTINGQKYTSLYMHLLSINVAVGDSVTSNTVIGTVGGGRKTSWDSCSTGAHLHFGIATGWYGKTYSSYSTYISNTIDPQKQLKLPNMGYWWYSR